ncbi:MAG: hypothetical protein HN341_19435 [Verrucomicrobia bacterium]|jgi:hypothetical protein|nr:hypothetical protein [Verrucomicrobiota bacterium]
MPRGIIDNSPEAVERRKLASGRDAIMKKVFEDETFWVDHVDIDTTLRIRNTLENAIANRKAIMASKAVDQLKDFDVVLPKDVDIKFAGWETRSSPRESPNPDQRWVRFGALGRSGQEWGPWQCGQAATNTD